MRKGLLLAIALLQTSALFGQAAYIRAVDSATLTTGKTFTHINAIGELNVNVEYVFSGSPASNSLILQGCMRGGTCQTLNTYAVVNVNTIVSVTGLYDYYTVAATLGGGSSPTVTVNWLGTSNSSPGSQLVDPCQSSGVSKKSKFANITTATTTQVVVGVANQIVSVCGFVATMTGTTTPDTFLLETGSGATCISPLVWTPTFNSGILTQGATVVSFNPGMTAFQSSAGDSVCVITTVATSPTINLEIVFVQQ